jgi:hypothetical protein
VTDWPRHGLRFVESLEGCCLLLRRKALDSVGLLDDSFFLYSEEIDLCRRLNEAGWNLAWAPEARVIHHGGASTRQVARTMFLQLYRSKVQYFRKHGGDAAALIYKVILIIASAPRILAGVLGAIARAPRDGGVRLIGRNYISLIRELPQL